MKTKMNSQYILAILLFAYISGLFYSSTTFCAEGLVDVAQEENTYSSVGQIPDIDTVAEETFDPGPKEAGSIEHNVNYFFDIGWHYSFLYKMVDNKPVFYKSVKHTTNYLFDNLAPGDWRLDTYSYWNNGKDTIYKIQVETFVPSGNRVNVDINTYPGYIKGEITLRRTQTNQNLNNPYIRANSEENSVNPSLAETSGTRIINGVGTYKFALPSKELQVDISTHTFKGGTPANS